MYVVVNMWLSCYTLIYFIHLSLYIITLNIVEDNINTTTLMDYFTRRDLHLMLQNNLKVKVSCGKSHLYNSGLNVELVSNELFYVSMDSHDKDLKILSDFISVSLKWWYHVTRFYIRFCSQDV